MISYLTSLIKFAYYVRMKLLMLIQIFILLPVIPSFSQVPDLRINEFLASNYAGLQDVDGDRPDWIELYNGGLDTLHLGGFTLTDDPTNPAKWTFPDVSLKPDSYLIVFASNKDRVVGPELHTNFALSISGEFVGIYNTSGAVVDSITFGQQQTDISFGRATAYPQFFVFFNEPTPGYENSTAYAGFTAPPLIGVPGGFYSGSVSVVVSPANAGDEIYYTTDGTIPDTNSEKYSGSITITETTALRLVSIRPSAVPSRVVTHTYFIDEQVNLPFISLVTDPDHLFSDETGIYVTGTNGIVGYCDYVTPRNTNQDWERPVNIELYETNGQRALNQGAGIKIFGGCSRTRYPQKSFSLYARRMYGDSRFRYPIFPERHMTEYESFNLRSSSDDQVYTMLRDGFSQQVLREFTDVDYGAYRPAVVFINGEYWGIHNIRERQNHDYLAGNYGVDPDKVTILKNNGEPVRGSSVEYKAMRDYAVNNPVFMPAVYENIRNLMDTDQYIDYQAVNIYMAEGDWPGNNIRYWKSSEPPYDRWRWIIFDRDQSFMLPLMHRNSLEMATSSTGSGWPNPPWSTVLFRRLLTNADFKNQFIQIYAYQMNTTFRAERIINMIDFFEANIADEMPRHIERWGGKRDADAREGWIPPTVQSMEEWRNFVNHIRIFAVDRPNIASGHMQSHFNINGRSTLSLNWNNPDYGDIYLYNKEITPETASGLYFNNIPIKLAAVPKDGHLFSHWVEIKNGAETILNDSLITVTFQNNVEYVAHFAIKSDIDIPVDNIPKTFALGQNYPNPFNPVTTIRYDLPQNEHVRLAVYDILGREVAVLVNSEVAAGVHTAHFNASNLGSGVYIYRLDTAGKSIIKSMTLIK
jgi:hypothetical protein